MNETDTPITSLAHDKSLKNWLDNFHETQQNSPKLDGPLNDMHQQIYQNKKQRRLEDLEYAGKLQDKELKKRIFDWVQRVVTCYLIFMAIVVLWHSSLDLSDAVMIALLTTTTINIIGLPALIIHSLFPKLQGDEKEIGDDETKV